MTFAHMGLAIAGIAAVSIPIIIHLLFRRRRRPVPWAAMRFIIEAMRRQRRKLRLEQLLLLLARCLLIALVGLAIGRPLLEKAGLLGSGGRDVFLVIDNGATSGIRGADGTPALDRLKDAAAEMLASLGPGDRAGLVTLASPAEAPVAPASANIAEVGRLIRELTPTDARADIGGALDRLASRLASSDEAARGERDRVAVILSEFRAGSADTTRALPTSAEGLRGVRIVATEPATTGIGNVQVVGIEPVRGVVVTGEGQGSERVDVRIRLRRTGPSVGEEAVTTVRVRDQGAAADTGVGGIGGEAVVRWDAGQSEAAAVVGIEVVRSAAWGDEIVLRAEVDRDALDADNAATRVVGLRERLRVGIIGGDSGSKRSGLGPADWVRLSLAPLDDDTVAVEPIEPLRIDLPVVSRLDAVFVVSPDLVPESGWATLGAFADRGGLVIVTPPENATTHVWADAMAKGLGIDARIAREATVHAGAGIGLATDTSAMLGVVGTEFERLAQPVRIQKSLAFESLPEGARAALQLADGSPWIVAIDRAERRGDRAAAATRGTVVVFGSALSVEWTDLPARPLMVPLMQELLREGVGRASTSGTLTAGVAFPVATDVDAATLENGASVLAGVAGAPVAMSRTAGVARLRDEAGRAVGLLAINTDVDGARTDVVDADSVRQWLGTAGAETESASGSAAARSEVQWMDLTDSTAFLSRGDRGTPVSLPLLAAALAVALLELAMARWFSHAIVGPGRGAPAATPEGAPA